LAEDGIPVTVTCRVLKIARQPYYRWLAAPVTDADLEQAHRASTLFDAHKHDPEFGYRFLLDEARDVGEPMAERTAWRICSNNGWWSAFGKKKARGKGKKPGPPVHDDLVQRNFTAQAPNSCGWAISPSTGPLGFQPSSQRSGSITRPVKQPVARLGFPSRVTCVACP
jgi:putative transposase